MDSLLKVKLVLASYIGHEEGEGFAAKRKIRHHKYELTTLIRDHNSVESDLCDLTEDMICQFLSKGAQLASEDLKEIEVLVDTPREIVYDLARKVIINKKNSAVTSYPPREHIQNNITNTTTTAPSAKATTIAAENDNFFEPNLLIDTLDDDPDEVVDIDESIDDLVIEQEKKYCEDVKDAVQEVSNPCGYYYMWCRYFYVQHFYFKFIIKCYNIQG